MWSRTLFTRYALAAAVMAVIQACGCNAPESSISHSGPPTALNEKIQAQIHTFCGDCHAMPDPATFPKEAWHGEVQRGYGFYYASGRTDLTLPIVSDTLQYFVENAPNAIALPAPGSIDQNWVDKFDQKPIETSQMSRAAVSFLDVVDLQGALGKGILFSDMHGGKILFSKVESGQLAAPIQLGAVSNPAVIRVCDWNQDGLRDLMVADLGSFLPEDHHRGRVVCLERTGPDAQFSSTTICDGIGRVASVELGDLDHDGLDDLLVAEFGWQTTGSIFYLSRKRDGAALALIKHPVDTRPGTIHLPMLDVNQDGFLDFVALVSQQYEKVDAFLNNGQGEFEVQSIFSGPEPSFGSSGIEVVDVNLDGKSDILYTNGDSFDSFVLKPSHGVHWLENKGDMKFEDHLLGKLPGAHRALAGDLDGDGINEIIAAAFVPESLLKAHAQRESEGLVVWKQGDSGFSKHVLTTKTFSHASICLADLDNNKKIDIVVGNFSQSTSEPAITVWMAR